MKQSEKIFVFIGRTAVIVIGASIIFTLLWLVFNHPQQAALVQQSPDNQEVVFCNNINIYALDVSNKDKVTGELWWSNSNGIFTNKTISFQRGLTYILWLKNDTYFTKPLQFTPGCRNENDSEMKNFKIDAYKKKDNLSMRSTDAINYLDYNQLKFIDYDDNTEMAVLKVQVYNNQTAYFSPFKTKIIIEVPLDVLQVSCTGEGNANIVQSYPIINLVRNFSNTLRAFDIESFNDGTITSSIICQFIRTKSQSFGKDIYITLYPENFYVDKEGLAKLDYADPLTLNYIEKSKSELHVEIV